MMTDTTPTTRKPAPVKLAGELRHVSSHRAGRDAPAKYKTERQYLYQTARGEYQILGLLDGFGDITYSSNVALAVYFNSAREAAAHVDALEAQAEDE